MKRNMLPTCIQGLNSAESTDVHHISKLWRNPRGPNKSHREAERKRREHINAHLGTLCSLLPKSNTRKRDKASLLAEVVQRLKELSKQADDGAGADLAMSSVRSDLSMESCTIPGEFDETNLSYHQGGPSVQRCRRKRGGQGSESWLSGLAGTASSASSGGP